jgi:hypothetical protein
LYDFFCSYLHKLQHLRATCVGRHQRTMTLPKRLIAQIDSFLPPPGAMHTLIHDLAALPCLVHGDINDDNVLGHSAPASESSGEGSEGSEGSGGLCVVVCACVWLCVLVFA